MTSFRSLVILLLMPAVSFDVALAQQSASQPGAYAELSDVGRSVVGALAAVSDSSPGSSQLRLVPGRPRLSAVPSNTQRRVQRKPTYRSRSIPTQLQKQFPTSGLLAVNHEAAAGEVLPDTPLVADQQLTAGDLSFSGGATGCDDCGGCGKVVQGALCGLPCPTCCGVASHCSWVYAELLYLRARKNEMAYAVPIDGPIVAGPSAPIQVGDVGVLDTDYESGFRIGANVALDSVSSIDVRYTLWESLTEDETSVTSPFALRSLVTHPASATASQDALSSIASLEIDFDTFDASYRHLLHCGPVGGVNFLIGGRYAKLEQQFDAEFVKLGTENVSTDIDFDGGGLRLGLETERYSCRNRLHVYANGYASFLAGRFRARYFQGQAFDPSVVDAEWEAGRVVPILDFEAGVGWTGCNGRLRLSLGYMVSAWFNTVKTQDFVNSIQTNDFRELCDSIWFDGLKANMAFRF